MEITFLNATFYYGQIKSEFRGNYALFVEVDSELKKPSFRFFDLNSPELAGYTSEERHFPARSYVGIRPSMGLRDKIKNMQKDSPNIWNGFDFAEELDRFFVREGVLKKFTDAREEMVQLEVIRKNVRRLHL